MSKMMKKMAIVENLMAKRPSGSATGSLPHSNGSSFTGVSRFGAISDGMPRRAPPTTAATANTRRIETYSILDPREPLDLALGVVRRAHQRARLDVGEPERAPDFGELGELVGMVEARHRQVPGRRAQVLAEREHDDVDRAQVPHRGHQLVALLAEPEDEPGLGHEVGRGAARAPEQLERPLVAAAVARDLVEPWDGLGVVVQHVGAGVDHRLERGRAALEVRDQ